MCRTLKYVHAVGTAQQGSDKPSGRQRIKVPSGTIAACSVFGVALLLLLGKCQANLQPDSSYKGKPETDVLGDVCKTGIGFRVAATRHSLPQHATLPRSFERVEAYGYHRRSLFTDLTQTSRTNVRSSWTRRL